MAAVTDGAMDEVTMVRNERKIRLYLCVPAGWLSCEVRRDSLDADGAVKATFVEASCISRERARERLPDVVEEFRRANWCVV